MIVTLNVIIAYELQVSATVYGRRLHHLTAGQRSRSSD